MPGPAKFLAAARARGLPALAAIALGLALATLAGPGVAARLRYERSALAAGEWWRIVSCHLVHYDLRHLALNLAGLALLWWLYATDARPREWLVASLAAALAVGLGLYALAPGVGWYLGASGVLHGLWAAAAVFALARSRAEGLASLALLAAKLAAERLHGPLSAGLDPALPVIVEAHLYGAFGGLAAALALRRPRAPL